MTTLMGYAKQQLEHVQNALGEAMVEYQDLEVQIAGLRERKDDLVRYIKNLEKEDDAQNAHALADIVTDGQMGK